jgi:hypothetical protein
MNMDNVKFCCLDKNIYNKKTKSKYNSKYNTVSRSKNNKKISDASKSGNYGCSPINYKGNKIHKTSIVDYDNLLIGKGNVIGPYAIIAGYAQHSNRKSLGKVIIGNNNIFREFFSVHRPVKKNGITKIGNNSIFFSRMA